jgi:hypothetical protein
MVVIAWLSSEEERKSERHSDFLHSFYFSLTGLKLFEGVRRRRTTYQQRMYKTSSGLPLASIPMVDTNCTNSNPLLE